MNDSLDAALLTLTRSYSGPGGAVAVLREGEVLARHAWGWANAERRIPFTPQTLFRLCSITKQFTCAVLLDTYPDPAVLDADVAARLPRLTQAPPRTVDLCHNQSGLRDYWAVAMLHGSPAEGAFGEREAAAVIGGTRTLQFAPGTRASYCNQNFRILADVLQERSGAGFADLLRRRVFDRAGMSSAFLAADTRAMPDGTEGYEGSPATGFRPAVNRIVWTGDAGLGASLDDMIAWERHIDATRDDPASLHGRIGQAVTFADGSPAPYGFGLARRTEWRRAAIGHGGALRGWRSHRMYLPAERISVVVLFNHMADARQAAMDLLGALLGETAPAVTEGAEPNWVGAYVEPETGLLARVESVRPGRVRLRYGQGPELLTMQADGSARQGATALLPDAEGLRMERGDERMATRLRRLDGVPEADIAGSYRCAELDAELQIVEAGGLLYGAFAGVLGGGRMERLEPIAGDVWTLPCPRALDVAPPGDWTLSVMREAGRPSRVDVGCWLARGLSFMRAD